jgi:hypothetical protein
MITPTSASPLPNTHSDDTYAVVNGEPVLTVLSYELTLTIDDLEKVIAAEQRELHQMRAYRDRLRQAVA